MANKPSAAKRARSNEKKRATNRVHQSKTRTLQKKVRALAADGKKEEAAATLVELQSTVDKAAKVGALHPNKAKRTKARASKLLK